MTTRQIRLLVLRGGAIGDFILTLPALTLLRERWPDAHIELIGYPHVACLAREAGLVNSVSSLDRAGIAQFFSLRPEFPDDLIAFIRSFDVVITYLSDRDGTVRENLLLAGARQVIYGSPFVNGGHAIDHLLKPLETLALYGEPGMPARLTLPHALREQGRARLAEMGVTGCAIALHPGSGGPKKNWPVERYLRVQKQLAARLGFTPVITLGEADTALLPHFEGQGPVLTGSTLGETAALLSACAAYIGNDSGITHLAAALGLPVVALFGPTDPEIWAPRGPRVQVLYDDQDQWSRLDVETVLKALDTLLSLES